MKGALIERAASIGAVEGRTLSGNALTFEVARIASDDGWRTKYYEEWSQNCANKTIVDRGERGFPVGIFHQWSPNSYGKNHHDVRPIGTVRFNPTATNLEFEFTLSNTQAANEALELVNDGAMSGVSLGSYDIRSSRKGNVTRREEIAIRELSLIPTGLQIYEDTGVTAIRGEQLPIIGTPNLDLARARLVLLRN